jgi:hypothetical protein
MKQYNIDKYLRPIVTIIVLIYVSGMIYDHFQGKSKKVESTTPPTQSKQSPPIDLSNENWYVFRVSARLDNDGSPMGECVTSEFTPAQLMEHLRKSGEKFQVSDDSKENTKPSAVLLEIIKEQGNQSLYLFRGKEFCQFSGQKLSGRKIHDNESYK